MREQVSSKSHNTHYKSDKINIMQESHFHYCKHILGMLKCHMNYAKTNIVFLKWCMVTDSNVPHETIIL